MIPPKPANETCNVAVGKNASGFKGVKMQNDAAA